MCDSHAGESGRDDQTGGGCGATVLVRWECRWWRLALDFGVRLLKREHVAHAAGDVCDGERGDSLLFSRRFIRVSNATHFNSAFAVLLLIFSISGDFRWNATLSAVARLFMYGAVAAALPALRRKKPGGQLSIAWRNSVCRRGLPSRVAAYDCAMA